MLNKKFRKQKEKTGYVYVLSNPLYPSLFKIGSTKLNPEVRADTITRRTGVLGIFIVEWFVEVNISYYKNLEISTHRELDLYRFLNHKEFFTINLQDAIDTTKRIIEERKIDIIREYSNQKQYSNPLESERIDNLKQTKIFYDQYEQYEIKMYSEKQGLQEEVERLQKVITQLKEESITNKHNLENLISDNKKYEYLLENTEDIIAKLLSYILNLGKFPKNLIDFFIRINDNEANYISNILEKLKKNKQSLLKTHIIDDTLFEDEKSEKFRDISTLKKYTYAIHK